VKQKVLPRPRPSDSTQIRPPCISTMRRTSARPTTCRRPTPREREGAVLRGEGWSLELAPGWTVEPGEREGDVRLGAAR